MHLTRCLAICIVATALSQEPTGKSGEAIEMMEFSRLENVWNAAHIQGDADALDRLWADDLVLTVPGMKVMAKSDVIGMWRSGRVKFQRYLTSDTSIRVYDNAAVVTGRLQRARDFNGRVADEDWRFTKVYVRRAGKWQVVAYHASVTPQ